MDLLLPAVRSILQTMRGLWPLWALLAACLVIKVCFQLHRSIRLGRSGIADIDRMDGRTFERYLRLIFSRRGYIVELTRYVGDYGADLLMRSASGTIVVQAKRSRRRVGVRAIQEVVASKGYYGASTAMVVTNAYFTRQARVLADRNDVELWSRQELITELLSAGGTTAAPPTAPPGFASTSPTHDTAAVCVVCGKPVSPRVLEFCRQHARRFGGGIYCYEHQRISGSA